MNRDWELIRNQLTDIEDGSDVLAEIPSQPKWTDDLTWQDYDRLAKEQRQSKSASPDIWNYSSTAVM